MLKPQVDKIEEVPETLREEYAPVEGGGFRLKVLGDFVPKASIEDTKGLKSALQKERDNAAASARSLKALQEQLGDVDPAKVAELVQKETERAEADAKRNGEWDKLKGQMSEQHGKALKDKDSR